MNLEKYIIEHSSPTLAGLKTASLFTTKFDDIKALEKKVSRMDLKFKDKGVSVKILRKNGKTALIYVYRNDMLISDMAYPKASEILSRYGYENLSTEDALKRLSTRLHNFEEFPHEIGLFLGYPPEDVEGFICNKGRDCNLCGYWKVYGNTNDAIIKFARYDKCKMVYKRLWQEGRDILQLTVKKTYVA